MSTKLSDIEYIEQLKNDEISIKDIKNPSEELQLAAVKQDYRAIKHIKNPTEKVKEAARAK